MLTQTTIAVAAYSDHIGTKQKWSLKPNDSYKRTVRFHLF